MRCSCLSLAVGCSSSGPPATNGATFKTSGGGSNGSETGASSGGSSQTNGSSGGLTGGGETSGGTSGGGVMGCQSACNLPGQYCDDAGQCVACLADDQCKSSLQPHCYNDAGPSFGTCVECLVSSHCQLGQVCSPELMCVPGCGDTQEACPPQTPICEGDSGVCVTCLSAAECSGGLVCENGACMECSGPMANYECYQNYKDQFLWVCSPEDNCVQCIMDGDCPTGEHCVGTGCQ